MLGGMASMMQRLDSFYNSITRLGGTGDKRAQTRFAPGVLLDDATLDNLYHFNDLAAVVCDTYPQEALRMGFDLTIPGDLDLVAQLANRIEELHVKQAVQDAAIWGRVFGDACVFIGVDDGQKVDRPLDYTKIRAVRFLQVYDKRDFTIESYYSNPLEPQFNTPETYRLHRITTPRGGGAVAAAPAGVVIHESRMSWFAGSRTSRQKLAENAGWHYSALMRPYEVLRDFEMSWAAAAHLLNEASVGVYKVKGLLEIIASKDGAALLEQRMAVIDAGRSVARSLVVDADGEDYERRPTQFGSVPDMLDRFASRFAATAGVPVTRLMGEAPAGLGATGASDTRFFYDRIENYRTDDLQPGIERILRCLLYEARKMTPDTEIEWSITWPSLYVTTDLETATMRKVVADTDAIYIAQGVVTPEEITLSRFGEGGWSLETSVDLDIRAAIVDDLTVEDLKPVPVPVPEIPNANVVTDNPPSGGVVDPATPGPVDPEKEDPGAANP